MRASISKHIVFPASLVELAEVKARRLGFNLSEYVRYLIAKAVEPELEAVYEVTEKENEDIGKSLEDYKKGRYTELRTKKDIKKFIDKL